VGYVKVVVCRYPVHTAKPYGQSGGEAALFLNLNTRWRSVVNITH